MGAGGALGCVPAGGVAERDGGGARDHLGEAAEADARCACDAGARAQAGDCRAEGAAGGTCTEEKLIMPLARLDSRRSLVISKLSGYWCASAFGNASRYTGDTNSYAKL